MSAAAIFGAGLFNAGVSAINNIFGRTNSAAARQHNYELNEMAASNADARTRQLYKDIYSPKALLKQYQEAGLSPSLMFGGTPGQGGMSGAQGAGTAGQPNVYYPMSMLEAAQAANLMAQTEKTEAETENVKEDTTSKEIQNEWNEMQKNAYKVEFTIMTSYINTTDGVISPYEYADNFYSFDSFLNACRDVATGETKNYLSTEAGVQTLRAIYIARNRYERDIAVLDAEKTSSKFQKSIVQAMQSKGFAEMNAEAAVAYLKANIETAELNETQKEAWNNLIDRLGKKGSTMRDVIVVMGMLINQAASNWKMPTFNTYQTNDNSVRTIQVGKQ